MKCPNRTTIAPCTCNFKDGISGRTAELHCFNMQLGDSRISEILLTFNSTPNVLPLSKMDLSYNSLTRVPKEISLFSSLAHVYLNGNEISKVESGAFNFSSQFREISFFNNELTNVEPEAFQGINELTDMTIIWIIIYIFCNGMQKYSGNFGKKCRINLNKNKITSFKAEIFQSILEKLRSYGGPPTTSFWIENSV